MQRYLRITLFLLPFYLYENLVIASGFFVIGFLIVRYEEIGKRLHDLEIREFVFFTYMFHMLIGERDFAYVGIEPIFITEITLFILGVFYIRRLIKVRKLLLPYYLLVVVGLLFALVYFPEYRLSALRDSLMIVYAIWVPIVYNVFSNKKIYDLFFELLKVFIVIKAVHYLYRITLIVTGLWFPTFEGFRFSVGYIIPSLVVISLVLPLREFSLKYKLLCLVMILAVFTAFHRSIFLGILLVYAVYFVMGSWKTQKSLIRYGTTGLTAIIAFIMIYTAYTDFDLLAFMEQKTSLDEGNINYRFIAWDLAFDKFQENFLIGFGVGKPLLFVQGNVFYDTADLTYFQIRNLGGNAQPHNSYVSILARFGILVFSLFVWTLVKPLKYGLENIFSIKKFSLPIYNLYLLLLGFLLFMYVFTFFNVVLEGPHHAFPFWLAIGLVLRYNRFALKYPKVKLVKSQ